ncbi:MAG: hypothetical protein WBG50_04775 [Desulfomonilaceae bacterium]
MGIQDTHSAIYLVGFGIVFVAAFFAGDVAGFIIESRTTRRWKNAAEKMGFEFDERKTRYPSLSEFFLPRLSRFHLEESAFCYGEALKTLKSTVQGFNIAIIDFAVWNLHMRVPLIFRGVVCLVTTEEINLPGQIGLLKYSSIFLEGFRWNRAFRPYGFPHDKEFSRSFALFGRPGSPPWILGPELRRFCVDRRRDIDVLIVNEKEVILLWPDQNPERFPSLMTTAIGIMHNLCESVPDSDCKVS